MHALLRPFAIKSSGDLARFGVILALAGLILFGALRYDNFLSPFNILSFLRYNSMFALIALGMAFVIITGGIDLSVGGTAAMASVVAALLSPYHWAAGLLGGVGELPGDGGLLGRGDDGCSHDHSLTSLNYDHDALNAVKLSRWRPD